jgi:hypothetical protein
LKPFPYTRITADTLCFSDSSLLSIRSGIPRPSRNCRMDAARRRGQGPKRRGTRRRSGATRP